MNEKWMWISNAKCRMLLQVVGAQWDIMKQRVYLNIFPIILFGWLMSILIVYGLLKLITIMAFSPGTTTEREVSAIPEIISMSMLHVWLASLGIASLTLLVSDVWIWILALWRRLRSYYLTKFLMYNLFAFLVVGSLFCAQAGFWITNRIGRWRRTFCKLLRIIINEKPYRPPFLMLL